VEGLRHLRDRLFAPVDIASLVVFRIAFGVIMMWEVWRYFDKGWIARSYLEPDFLFKYGGFAWVEPWPGSGLHWHFAVLGLAAFMITIGAFYRLACIVFLLGFAYVFLLDQARYLNHFYLVMLFACLLCVVPAHRAFSVDAWRRPAWRREQVPAWPLWLLRAQVEIVLVFAGLVKVNPDWLRLQPLGMWLAEDNDFFLIGPLFTETWVIAVAAYGTILLHLVGAPLLLWSRTRGVVFALYVAFHLMNHFLFEIGIFPWLTMAATTLFFAADWPRRVLHSLAVATAGFWNPGGTVSPGPPRSMATASGDAVGVGRRNLVLVLISAWLLLQVLVPVRHLLYPGDVTWTEEGHRFAWRMKLRDKDGRALFEVRDPASGQTWCVYPRWYLTARQARKMPARPDMIVQFARYLVEVWRTEYGVAEPEVRADVLVSLNGRPPARMVDPAHDLSKADWGIAPATWLTAHPGGGPGSRRDWRVTDAAPQELTGTGCMRLWLGD